jgi:hypothetical protein
VDIWAVRNIPGIIMNNSKSVSALSFSQTYYPQSNCAERSVQFIIVSIAHVPTGGGNPVNVFYNLSFFTLGPLVGIVIWSEQVSSVAWGKINGLHVQDFVFTIQMHGVFGINGALENGYGFRRLILRDWRQVIWIMILNHLLSIGVDPGRRIGWYDGQWLF